MKTDEIRKTYLEFFKSKGHMIVLSDCLVPKDDPTLLFTGAGMNQFKEKFLGRNVTYKRATSSQKCLRTGDLDNVGRTSGHHTFFEMLGNFSFGDYFKKEAISWAWEFFTKVLKIDPERLWASVYKDDSEAYDIWKNVIKIPQDRIMKFGEKDNFWPSEAPTKGPNGPCGPCSEIFYDYGKDVGCRKPGCNPECNCGRFVEVWNMVFTQYDRQPDGTLKPLPAKNIDTGMGLERLASVMQGVKTNFEIDIFVPIINAIEKDFERQGGAHNNTSKINAIADHIRAVTFCIADGVMPSNEERGYIVRKLIRRAMLHSREMGIRKPFFYNLVGVVADVMKEAYPELQTRREEIAQFVKKEEELFSNVIATQLPKAEDAFANLSGRGKVGKDELASLAFTFYDTYGMPYDLIEDIAESYNLVIDRDIFENLLDKQRTQSRSKTKIKGEIFSTVFIAPRKEIEALNFKTEFVGYDVASIKTKILKVLQGNEVFLEKTPFYTESGGQVGDTGTIKTDTGIMEVQKTIKYSNTTGHIGKITQGYFIENQGAEVSVNENNRKKVMANHTATHLLQAALRKVLGEHVKQTGSSVDAEHLRFDFTHMKKMEAREIARVEELVNENIKKAIAVKKEIKDIESARKDGAMALFGEKYGDKVRVVTVGDVSKELCGGTHVNNTKEIDLFKIMSESSIASGVRRIEAVTGDAAKKWIDEQEKAEGLKLDAENKKEEENKRFAVRLKEECLKLDAFIKNAQVFGGVKVIAEIIDDINMEGLRSLSDKIREKEKSAVVILATKNDDKVSFVTSVTDDIVKRNVSAGEIAKALALLIDGSGGGRPNFAQGGGKSPAKLTDAMSKIIVTIKERLK